jgi:hypothetical protein
LNNLGPGAYNVEKLSAPLAIGPPGKDLNFEPPIKQTKKKLKETAQVWSKTA